MGHDVKRKSGARGHVSGSRAAQKNSAQPFRDAKATGPSQGESFYRLLADNTYDWTFFCDTDGKYLYVSPSCERISGYPATAFLADSAMTAQIVHPEDKAVFETHFGQASSGKDAARNEFRIVRRDGAIAWVGLACQPVYDEAGTCIGWCGTIRDITDRKAAEEALRESEDRYRMIFEGANEGIVFIGADNRRDVVNHRMAEMCGYTVGDLQGKPAMTFIHPDDQARLRENNRRRRAGEKFERTYEFRVIHRDGHTITVEGTFDPIKRDGQIVGICGILRDITDRKRTERELKYIYTHAPCLLWYADVESRDGEDHWTIGVPNVEAAQRYLPMKTLPGQDYFDALMKSREEFVKEARQLDENASRAFHEGRSHLSHEFPCRRADDEIRWIHEDAYIEPVAPNRFRVIGVSTDVTERKKAEADLKQSLSLLEATIESTTDGVLVVDRNGRVVRHNQKFIDMWRIPADVAGRRDDSLLLRFVVDQLSDPKAFLSKVEKLYASPESESYDVIEFKDDRIFERFSQPQRIDGKSVGRVWSFRDITERRRAEEHRARLEAQVLHSQKLESLGVLAGGIAHDFNNILTGVLGNAELALMDLLPSSPAYSSVQNIQLSAHRAADLTRQMLAYSGKGKFLIQPIRLHELVEELANLLQVSISKKCVLTCQFEENLPLIRGDATQLRQVIMNFIVNASEAIGDESGVIRVTTGSMVCDRAYLSECYVDDQLEEGQYVYLEVTDSGCGITAAARAKLFDPFFTTKFTGRGLGLAAVMGIVRSHGGTIRVDSEPGQGATFRALFPLADDASQEPEVQPAPDLPVTPSRPVKKQTVLVVDDEDAVRQLVAKALKRAGYETIPAKDGLQGVELFQAHKDDIAVILLDMTMPRMDGKEVAREIQRLSPSAKIILTSGHAEQDARSNIGDAELTAYLQKPFRTAELVETIRHAIETTS